MTKRRISCLISSSPARTFPDISSWANSLRPLTRSRCFKALCPLVIDRFQSLTDYASVVNRLATFKKECEKADAPEPDGAERIEVVEDGRLAIKNLTLKTPDRSRTLLKGLST